MGSDKLDADEDAAKETDGMIVFLSAPRQAYTNKIVIDDPDEDQSPQDSLEELSPELDPWALPEIILDDGKKWRGQFSSWSVERRASSVERGAL